MELRQFLSCLWPGLPELWWRGRLPALPVAIAFGLTFNALLVMWFIYPQWVSGGLITMAVWIGIATWGFFVVRRVRELPELLSPRTISDEPDRFPEARDAYLRRDWKLAERTLTGVLAIEPRDPPALLLLTSIYRHTDRLEAASVLLSEISRLEVAERWLLEIESERVRIDRLLVEHANVEQTEENNDENDAADLTAEPRRAA